MDKIGKLKLLGPGVALAAIGCLCLYFSASLGAFIASGITMMAGYLVSMAVLGATVRDETPRDNVGLFQGVRMVFAVLIPMIVGPLVSQAFFEKATLDPTNPSLNGLKPTNMMFLVALAFFAVSIAPIIWLLLTKKAFAKKPVEDPLVK
jgi:MFS family permease